MKRKRRDAQNYSNFFDHKSEGNNSRPIIIAITGLIVITGFIWLFITLTRDLPSLTELERYQPELVTKIYSADHKVIKELYTKKRILTPLSRIPDYMWQAVLATEDRSFLDHWGLNSKRIVKAFLVDIFSLSFKQGASTITQQLARQLYLNLEKTVIRKMKEILTAIQIERAYTKREILEMYLNHMYFGHGAYGVQAAALKYFGKNIWELNLEECALLIALLQRPNYYSPYMNYDKALARRNLVLRNMFKCGYISEEQYRIAEQNPISVKPQNPEEEYGIAPYFTEYVRQQLQEKYGFRVYTDGLSVYTTLDTRVQKCAEEAVKAHLLLLQAKINKRVLARGELRNLIDHSILKKHSFNELISNKAFVDSVLNTKVAVQVALVAIEPATGHILAMIGGRDFRESQFNRAIQAQRQPGSAFKPFVFTAAIDNGYSPSFELLNQPVVLFMVDGQRWAPQNYDESHGGPTTLREGLRRSLNLIAARLVQEVVPPTTVVDYARKLGLTTPLPPVDAIALGATEVIPIEITSAFGAFGNKGVLVKPMAILKVEDKYGNVLEENLPQSREVLRQETAYIMTNMMETVINRGTGVTARTIYKFDRPAAGKTGTTNEFTDAWFVGFTPQIAAGVWVGLDDPKLTLGEGHTGAAAALPIWAPFMKMAHDTLGLPYESFKIPPGVVKLEICNETKKLANETCPEIVEEIFEAKLAPTEHCDKHLNLNFLKSPKRGIKRRWTEF